ncbi:hypothetical protein ACI79J_01790 [Geodermatophilus sp. SYSU D01062]
MHARRAVVVITGTIGLAVLSPGAVASATPGGCQAFGQNVAGLAQLLGSVFGATASGVASSAPGAFRALVVQPEQEMLCLSR